MNVAFAIPHNPTYGTTGGAVRAGLQLASALDDLMDVSVTVFKIASQEDPNLSEEYGIELHPLTPRYGLKRTLDTVSPLPTNYNNVFIGCTISDELRSGMFDVLHIHNTTLLRSTKNLVRFGDQRGLPTVITCHALHETLNRPDLLDMGRGLRAVYRTGLLRSYFKTLRVCDALIAFTDDTETLERRCPSAKVYLGSNGIDVAEYRFELDKNILEKYDLERPFVFYSGGFHRSKGIDRVVELTHKLEAGSVGIAGPNTGEMAKTVEQEMDQDRGRLLGYVPIADLKQLYALADVFFYPTRSDNFPLVILEAMVNGTPIVAADVGGIRRQVGDAGFVGTDTASLIAETQRLLKDPAKRDQLGKIAAKRVQAEFTWTAVASDHQEIYADLLSGQ